MNKTLIALTTSLLLATGGVSFADSSALDVQNQHRSASVDYTPTAAIDLGGIAGDDSRFTEEGSAQNGFGDHSPAPQVLAD